MPSLIDFNKVSRQFFHSLAFMVVRVISNILLIVILAKNLSPSGFGVFSLIRTTVIIGVYLVGLELYNYTNRNIPGRNTEEGAGLFGNVLFFETGFMILVFACLFGFGLDGAFARAINIGEHQGLLRIGFVILFMTLISREFMRYFVITKRIQYSNWINFFISNLWIILAALWWLWRGEVTIGQVIGLWLVTTTLALVYIGFTCREWKYLPKNLSPRTVKKAIGFSFFLYITSMTQQTSNRADFYLLSYYHGTRIAGIYTFSYTIVAFGIGFIGTILSDLLIPYITEYHNLGKKEEKLKVFTRLIHYGFLFIFPALLVFILEGRGIIPLIGKAEYLEAYRILPFLVIIMTVGNFVSAAQYLIFLENRIKLIALVNLVGAVTNIGLNLILIPRFSYFGAAIASVCSFSLVLMLFYWQIRRFKLIDISRIRWARLGSVFAGFTLFGYGLRYVLAGWIVPDEPYLLIVWSILFMTLYIFGVWRYFLEDADRAEIRKLAEVIKRRRNAGRKTSP
jgi:O-antigen/teichoic acid export membrane protein